MTAITFISKYRINPVTQTIPAVSLLEMESPYHQHSYCTALPYDCPFPSRSTKTLLLMFDLSKYPQIIPNLSSSRHSLATFVYRHFSNRPVPLSARFVHSTTAEYNFIVEIWEPEFYIIRAEFPILFLHTCTSAQSSLWTSLKQNTQSILKEFAYTRLRASLICSKPPDHEQTQSC
jgi:hypothetical protein